MRWVQRSTPPPGGGRWVSGSTLHRVLVQLFTLCWYIRGGVLVKVEALADIVEEVVAIEMIDLDSH